MEENNQQLNSIWGRWWMPIRKWFYPAWLIYETSYRFYDYSASSYQYFISQQDYFGKILAQVLATTCSLATFSVCTVFLTVPVSWVLYKFFDQDTLTNTPFEQKIKRLL